MSIIAVKFGGSSLASAAQFEKVRNIITSDPGRRYVVASAPGKRNSKDTKVTDLLYLCYDMAALEEDFEPALSKVAKRFRNIITDLQIDFDLDSEIEIIRRHLLEQPDRDYMASRGEYLNSKILAKYLGYEFVDPQTCVFFDDKGVLRQEKTNTALGTKLQALDHAVVAGFYGARPDGSVKTFSRGGSDVTGAIVARAAGADVYENWTDVSGMLSADPRIVENPRPISRISYRELRELSYMGASVLHEDAVFPVRKAGIPINIRNTNAPEDEGTWIVRHLPEDDRPGSVTGIAGKKGFTSILIEKSMMNTEVGFASRLLQIIAMNNISCEHIPSGIDNMSVIVNTAEFEAKKQEVLDMIQASLRPDTVTVQENLALIAVVGHGMKAYKGIAAKIFKAVTDADVNIRMIDQGSSELSIILAVSGDDYEKTIQGIYRNIF